ncbi:MAG TPA: aspartate kinase [Pirellulales bacterium]|jgi:aspartate kinase|nr:aspartate kinase [Pirellulales bacterium]
MRIVVQKFGGTSVADSQKILAAARKAIRTQQQGNQVVMVVSAMGHQTDHLVDLAGQITDRPSAREMDMLLSTGEQVSVALMAMAIQSLGSKAVSLTGAQIGIRTDSTHTKARIHSISTDRMRQLLDEGNIVIAAGFQGIDENFNITTLGRGGSDTTAVALAAVLRADACEIYTDVDGVYTTDPRQLPEARRLKRISYDEMLELASLGAAVMHSRSIEFAKKFNVPIHVRSSFSDVPGTMIVAESESTKQPVSGAALVKDEARVTMEAVPDRPGISHAIFSQLAQRHIAVDMIVQNVSAGGKADISFTVPRNDLAQTLEIAKEAAVELGGANVSHDDDVAKLSVVGLGMARQTGVAQKMFNALGEAGINIETITTSEIKISVLIAREQALPALRAVHAAFGLNKEPANGGPGDSGAHALLSTALDIVRELQGMEDLTIDEITLDEKQARVSIEAVPDRPGTAAALFKEIAAASIFVDMIVQSYSRAGKANLTFTVPEADLQRSAAIAQSVASQCGCGSVSSSPKIDKISVQGIGMRSHSGVALGLFKSLSDAGINLDLMSTSEVRVNVLVDGAVGQRALACLQTTFGTR